ncbi:oncostatin-M-specific receptor subunit beta isoform X2 [Erythrolamprus reginae]|uniref:oncostatin-M-specific receptor subunit beta isoform X2 n=1 Tax=Erythrolamprus reginae TaxID=121349 RepID=UPI00396C50DF
MDHCIFHTILLCIPLCLGLVHSQDKWVFEPRNLRIHSDKSLQQLILKWDVSDDSEAYNSKINIVFNIEIRLREEERILANENYATVLNKSRQYQWSFISEVPLECATHEARIRSKVTSSEIWSSWTHWVASAYGPDALSNEKHHILPEGKVSEEGSNVTFCCIAKENESVTSFTFDGENRNVTHQRRILETKKTNSSFPARFQLACGFTGGGGGDSIYIYSNRQPDKPQNLSCETEDMINIRCTWEPGYVVEKDYIDKVCPMEFNLSDVSSTKTYCSTKFQNYACSFKRDNQFLYNVNLTSRNCLGQKEEQLSFNVMNRVRPVIIVKPSVGHLNATFIQLSWQIKPIDANLSSLCQINVGENKYNITAQSNSKSHFLFQLGGLQPATKYRFKVRCAADVRPFWKWSNWTQSISAETSEAAPTGLLDIWRHINSGLGQRDVTVFWRESSDFHANGKIQKYHLSWENLEDPSVRHNDSVSASQSYTISLGNHSYKILVWAQNSVSTSSPSVIIIPATERNVHYSEETTDNNEAHKIYIAWKHQSKFSQYVIDWCNQPTSPSCDFQWKKYGQIKSSDHIASDAFKPGVRYTFNVYGIQDDRSHLLEKKAKYLKEMEPPSHDLPCNISSITANSFKVTWNQYGQEFKYGFIRGYMLYMKMDNQNCSVKGFKPLIHPGNLIICSYKIEKPSQTEFTVEHLKPSTKYLFAVQAYAVNPNYTDGVVFKTVNTRYDEKWLFYLLYLLLLIPLILMCMCASKSNRVRNCLCPAIPQPKVTPFFKMSLGITEVNDMVPNQLVMLDKPQELRPKQTTLGILLENMTYSQSTYYPEVQIEERTNQNFNSDVTSYKPLQDFGFTISPKPCAPDASLYSKDNLNYLYQMDVPPSLIQGTDLSCSVHFLDYRPQRSTSSRRNSDY